MILHVMHNNITFQTASKKGMSDYKFTPVAIVMRQHHPEKLQGKIACSPFHKIGGCLLLHKISFGLCGLCRINTFLLKKFKQT